MTKPRIPLPKQTQQTFKDKSKYDRKIYSDPANQPTQEYMDGLKEIQAQAIHEDLTPDWQVDCPACGVFTQIQKTDPTICPKCGKPDIDTLNLGA